MTESRARLGTGLSSVSRFVVGVDRERCQGHARCWQVLPELFTIDEEGYSNLGRDVPVPADWEEQARHGVDSCPELALRMERLAEK